jgi:hypothetical protein
MPAPPRKRPLGQEQRRALLLLAGVPFGATEAAMLLHGFTHQTLASLIRAGFVTVQREKAGGQLVGRVRVTDAGRRATLSPCVARYRSRAIVLGRATEWRVSGSARGCRSITNAHS